MATINNNGISIETLPEWKEKIEAVYLAVDPEWDLSTNTPDGQIVAALSEMFANVDESILDTHNAADPDKSRGQSLDAIMVLSSVERKLGTYSTAIVQLTGTQNTLVPVGTLIENAVTGTKWALDVDVSIGASATDAAVTCKTIGAQTAGIGELTKIATIVTGLTSVNNSASAILGQNAMKNEEARAFREETISKPACNQIDAIYANVADVDGVSHVAAYNNNSNVADSNEIPAKSFAIIAAGGLDADIAKAIYDKLNPGPSMEGGTNPITINVASDVSNNDEDIIFGRPTAIRIYVRVNITQTGLFPDSAVQEIKTAIVKFAAGELFESDLTEGYGKRGFAIGEDISSGLLHTPVNYYVGGIGQGYVTTINIGTSASPSSPGTVIVDWDELGTIAEADVNVVVS